MSEKIWEHTETWSEGQDRYTAKLTATGKVLIKEEITVRDPEGNTQTKTYRVLIPVEARRALGEALIEAADR